MLEQVESLCRAIVDAFDQVVFISGRELHRYSAGMTGDHRPRFPECFGNDESESFTERLLQHYVSCTLECIDFHAADARKICEHVKVGIINGFGIDLVQNSPSLGIVSGHCAEHRELNFWPRLLHKAISFDDAERVLPGIETRHLQ